MEDPNEKFSRLRICCDYVMYLENPKALSKLTKDQQSIILALDSLLKGNTGDHLIPKYYHSKIELLKVIFADKKDSFFDQTAEDTAILTNNICRRIERMKEK